jgi:hypothetical protein
MAVLLLDIRFFQIGRGRKKGPLAGVPAMQKHITSFLLPYAGIDRIR